MIFSPFSFNLTKKRYRTFIPVVMLPVASIQEGVSAENNNTASMAETINQIICFQHTALNEEEEIARDVHAEEYLRFLKSKLVWTDPNDPNHKIELKISDLADPLNGEFDLKDCGNVGSFMAIMTGYRTRDREINPVHDGKFEIWITPAFMPRIHPNPILQCIKNINLAINHYMDPVDQESIMGKKPLEETLHRELGIWVEFKWEGFNEDS